MTSWFTSQEWGKEPRMLGNHHPERTLSVNWINRIVFPLSTSISYADLYSPVATIQGIWFLWTMLVSQIHVNYLSSSSMLCLVCPVRHAQFQQTRYTSLSPLTWCIRYLNNAGPPVMPWMFFCYCRFHLLYRYFKKYSKLILITTKLVLRCYTVNTVF